MAILFLLLAASVLPLLLLAGTATLCVRLVRRLAALKLVRMSFAPAAATPGGVIDVRAKVVPRRGKRATVRATMACTMFGHRARTVFSKKQVMQEVPEQPGEFRARLSVPASALRSGAAGAELSALFSEDLQRLLVGWTVGLEVEVSGRVIHRESHAVDVPEGRPIRADKKVINDLVVELVSSFQDELLLNWLVQMAARDGEIALAERSMIHDVLRKGHGIADPAAADERIEQECQRQVSLEPSLLRKHLPLGKRINLYRSLYLMAWSDGVYDPREHTLLRKTRRAFGLSRRRAREVELEILADAARSSFAQ